MPPIPPAAPSARVAPVAGTRLTGPIELAPEPEPAKRRSLGKIIGSAATALLVLAIGAVAVKIIVTPTSKPPSPAAAFVEPNASSASAGPSVSASAPGVSATTGGPATSPGDPSGARMPTGDMPGWHQTFADDFTNGLDPHWDAYTGQPGGDPGGWFDASHVSVTNGMLHIGAWKQESPNGNLYVSGGISNAKMFSQTYGKYAIRFQMDKGYGIAYTLQLWPTDDNWPPEIDILEDNAKGRDMTSATMHYGSNDSMMHKEIKGDFTGWHTAELEWAPGKLTYRLDGNVWTTMATSHVPSTPMSIAIQTQAWPCGNPWEGCPNSTTPAKVNLQVDWVVAYSATK
jgi:beta-glucanase (GH16 family)